MKIVLTTAFWGYNDGGMAVACQRLVDLFAARGHQVYVVAYPDSDEGTSKTREVVEARLPNVSFIREVPSFVAGGYRSDLAEHLRFASCARRIVDRLAGESLDLCIAFGAGLNGLFASHVSVALRIPLVVCLRGSDINLCLSDMKLRLANRECLLRAASIVGLSQELVDRAREIAPESQATYCVIPNHYPLAGSCPSRPICYGGRPDIVLGIASRYLNEKKGVSAAIKVLAQLVGLYPEADWRLDLVGEVDTDLLYKYKELASGCRVQDRISWSGLLAREQWLDRARQWDAALQMSPFEGFCNTNVESWAAGVPVLVTNTGYIAEQLRNVAPELVFMDWSESTQASQIADVLLRQDLSRLTSVAIEHFSTLLDVEQVWQQWRGVFQRHINRQRPPEQSSLEANLTLATLIHDISAQEYSAVAMPVERFEAFVNAVNCRGYRLCSAAEYALARQDRDRCVILTFDDAYEGVYKFAYPILLRFGFTATVFVLSECIGGTNDWNPKDTVTRRHLDVPQLETLRLAGWEIGSHGTQHRSLLRLSECEVRETLDKSRAVLAALFGQITSYAYPYGHQNELIQEVARKCYDLAFVTTGGGGHWLVDRYQLRRYSPSEILTIIGAS